MEEIPAELIEQIDVLYAALKQTPELLTIGRAYGLRVGLSAQLAATFLHRHGEDAEQIVANAPQVPN